MSAVSSGLPLAEPISPEPELGKNAARNLRWLYGAGYALLLALALLPLFTVAHPPLQDYANHLARMFILSNPEDPILQEFWQITWRPVPNLATDLLIPGFSRWMPLAVAGKVFVALTIVLATAGTAAVQWAIHRRISPYFSISFLFVYHQALEKGFLSYSFACGLALWAFAGWVLLEKKGAPVRFAYGVLASLVLYFAHLHGYGVFVLAIVAYELGALRGSPLRNPAPVLQAAIAGASALPALLIFLFLSPKESGHVDMVPGGLANKLAFSRYLMPSLAFSSNAALSLVLFSILVWTLWSRLVRLPRRMWPVLGVLIFAYFILPSKGIGGANIDWRTLIPVPFLFVAAAAPKPVQSPKAAASVLFAIALICELRFVSVQSRWRGADRDYQTFHRLAKKLPEGTSLISFIRNVGYVDATVGRSILELSSFAVIERRAFVPSLFSYVSQQPLSYRPSAVARWDLAHYHRKIHVDARKLDCRMLRRYAYALLIDPKPSDAPCGSRLVTRDGDFSLFRLRGR